MAQVHEKEKELQREVADTVQGACLESRCSRSR